LREIPTVAGAFRLALSPDGRRLAAAREGGGSVSLCDRATGLPEQTLAGEGLPAPGLLAFSRDGKRLIAAGSYHAVAWEVGTGRRLAFLDTRSGLKGLIGSVDLAADGATLVAASSSSGPAITVWDLLCARPVWQSPPGTGGYTACLAPGGRLLAAFRSALPSGRGTVAVFELPSGRTVAEAEVPGEPISLQPFSPDGRWLATVRGQEPVGALGGFGVAANRAPAAEVIVQPFPARSSSLRIAHSSPPSACAFAPDSRLLAVGYRDGSVHFWDLAAGEEVFRVALRPRAIVHLAFSGDGSLLAATDGQTVVQLLDLSALRRQLSAIGLEW
jgi:WD40 repeat protein